MRFEGVVEDFNYGTLLRLDCSKGYTEENTIFGEPARCPKTSLSTGF